MKAHVWRAVALVVIAAAMIFVCYDAFLSPLPDYGLRTTGAVGPGTRTERVVAVSPNSPAAQAGIAAGDTISFGRTPLERAQVRYAAPGTAVAVAVNGARLRLIAPKPFFQTVLIVPLVIRLAFLAVAALLAWRRPEDPAVRALTIFLWCFGLLIGLPNTLMPTPLLTAIVFQTGSTALLMIAMAAAATFAARFPSGIAQPIPGALARITQLCAVAALLVAAAGTLSAASGRAVTVGYYTIVWLFVASAALVVAILILAYVQGAPSERQRRRWVFLLLGVALVAIAIDIGVQNTAGYSEVVDNATLIFIGAIPFGLAYVILRHRVIDVGFVISRAVVYGALSVIIVGIFVIVETLMSKYVEQHSRAGSIAVQLAVALALGFSIRFIHTRVDRVVDRLLFRQRYLDEAAIADFTEDAHYITNAETLLERCVATVLRHARASNAGVWLRDDSGLYRREHATFGAASVDENDPALVAMRARRVIADLHALASALPGVLAFPMIVRGELIGTLVCGTKEHAESYDPDETAALRDMASAVGHALDALRIRGLEKRLRELEGVRRVGLAP
jgi:hypothetical protein